MLTGFCAFCGSDQVEGASVEITANGAEQEISCLFCDSVYFDRHELVECFDENGPIKVHSKLLVSRACIVCGGEDQGHTCCPPEDSAGEYRLTFEDQAHRDSFLHQFPGRTCSEVPGLFTLPGGWNIGVRELVVTLYPGT